jgi:lysophospholipase L1-like esterase
MLIVCHGDSLTEASDVNPAEAWPALMAARLNAKIINSGIGGDTSGGLLGRFYHDVVRHRPKAVIILGGANDLWWDIDIGPIQANLFAMACQARFHHITPVLGLPLPLLAERARTQDMLQPAAGWEVCCRKLAALVDALRSASRACSITCLDFHSLFLDPRGSVRGELYLGNGLHPNASGHRRMADAAVDLLRALPLPTVGK